MNSPGRGARRRSTLATRMALLGVGIAVITALIAGVIATQLIRSAGTDSARRTLGRLADVAQSIAGESTGRPALIRLRGALQGLGVQSGAVKRDGTLVTGFPLVRRAVTPGELRAVITGSEVHAVNDLDGTTVFVEGRPTTNGGIVVVQRRADATAQDDRALNRLLLALLIAAVAAVLVGLLVAWRLARPLRRAAAAAHALAGGRRDVTVPVAGPAEVAEVSEALNALSGALVHSEARQREFLLSVSHDLRTPLTAIHGYAESLAEDVVPADETAHVGGVMLREAQRLERLVGDLLDLARLDADDFRIELTDVDVVELARDAAHVWDARSTAAGVLFRLAAPDSVPAGTVLARTDPARLRQLLDGLFDNALRVVPAGRPIVLAVDRDAASGAVIVELRDGGPGLSDDDLAVAFEQGVLHQRYRGVRQVGTGLGLAIVHGLVTRLGGSIEAGHAPEGGARFTVRLPPA